MSPEAAGSPPEILIPDDLRQTLAKVPAAEAAWKNLTSIGRRDFVGWINEAKQPETRARRITRCCENLLKGKKRPCCYAVVPMDFYKVLGENPVAKAQWSTLSPDEKRDLTGWIEEADGKEQRKGRVVEACALLASGKRAP